MASSWPLLLAGLLLLIVTRVRDLGRLLFVRDLGGFLSTDSLLSARSKAPYRSDSLLSTGSNPLYIGVISEGVGASSTCSASLVPSA